MSLDIHNCHDESKAYWNEQVGDLFLITLPSVAVFLSASPYIPHCPVGDHDHEENEIKPRKWTPSTVVDGSLRQLMALKSGGKKLT
jgi:hypothetical protein